MAKVSVLRVYDETENGLSGEKHFVILHGDEESYDIDWMVNRIAAMSWQDYDSYAFGTVELTAEDKLYWCEILGGDYKEICIDCARVNFGGMYDL